ncbi:MAG: molecular chaperone TorD family protein [Anaerolinea sp.]|nr:molecular chaperone TorD family protein [Anaerolinea sp.]
MTVQNQTHAAEWTSLLTGEMLLFELLGRVLYANPSREWVEPLIADDLFESVPFAEDQDDVIQGVALLSQWRRTVGAQLNAADLVDLRADYAQLFIGNNPMSVPPWESVYFSKERLTFQQETLNVRRWFARLGLQINPDSKDAEDHIAFELTFIARCAELALQAYESQNTAAFEELITVQRTFLQRHLLRWGGKWAELAYAHARTDFYRGLALVVRGALQELAQVFDVAVPREIQYPGLSSQ